MATLELLDFVADRPASDAHAALLAADRAADRARHCAVLWFGEILRRGLFRELGYGSMAQYAKVALGFSSSKTTDFMTLARKLEALPAVRASLAAGEIGYTKAREVVRVATARTDAQWAEAARVRSRADLVQRVKTVQAKAKRRASAQLELAPAEPAVEALAREVPVRVGLTFTPEQHARWEAAWEKLRKLGAAGDRIEVLLDGLAGTIEALTSCEYANCGTSAPRGGTAAAGADPCALVPGVRARGGRRARRVTRRRRAPALRRCRGRTRPPQHDHDPAEDPPRGPGPRRASLPRARMWAAAVPGSASRGAAASWGEQRGGEPGHALLGLPSGGA